MYFNLHCIPTELNRRWWKKKHGDEVLKWNKKVRFLEITFILVHFFGNFFHWINFGFLTSESLCLMNTELNQHFGKLNIDRMNYPNLPNILIILIFNHQSNFHIFSCRTIKGRAGSGQKRSISEEDWKNGILGTDRLPGIAERIRPVVSVSTALENLQSPIVSKMYHRKRNYTIYHCKGNYSIYHCKGNHTIYHCKGIYTIYSGKGKYMLIFCTLHQNFELNAFKYFFHILLLISANKSNKAATQILFELKYKQFAKKDCVCFSSMLQEIQFLDHNSSFSKAFIYSYFEVLKMSSGSASEDSAE